MLLCWTSWPVTQAAEGKGRRSEQTRGGLSWLQIWASWGAPWDTAWYTGERSREAAGQSGQSGDSRIYFQIRVSSLPSFQIYDQINEYHTYFSPREEYKIKVSQPDCATKWIPSISMYIYRQIYFFHFYTAILKRCKHIILPGNILSPMHLALTHVVSGSNPCQELIKILHWT